MVGEGVTKTLHRNRVYIVIIYNKKKKKKIVQLREYITFLILIKKAIT